jgi:hypothetical protein
LRREIGVLRLKIPPAVWGRVMEKVYVPYLNDLPATISVNGHRLVIVSKDSQILLKDLKVIGGDSVREISILDGLQDEALALAQLATTIKGGVVMAPKTMRLSAMIKNLEKQLPWLH